MKAPKPRKSKEEMDKLKEDIKKKRDKLKEEYGMMDRSEESNLPPDIENEWLNHIIQFEEAAKNARQISVYDRIGKPPFKPVGEIPESEISRELDRLLDIMAENSIAVDTICEVDDKELYRFITEELFEHEMDDIHVEGMVTHYTYEEFHPNHDYDIRRNSEFFIESVFDTEREFKDLELAKECIDNSGNAISSDAMVKRINNFRNAYEKLTLEKFEIKGATFKDELGEVSGYVNYKCLLEDSGEELVYEGDVKIYLRYEWEYWSIYRFDIPGVKV